MRAAAFASFALSALLIVAVFAFAVASIWLEDQRWGATACLLLLAVVATVGGGAALLAAAPDRE